MPNAFDEFDVAAPAAGNPFDQFDAPTPLTDQQMADAGRYWERINREQAASHEMNAHDSDALRAIASDPKGFLKSIPGDVMSIATAPGKLAYLSAADVWSHLFGQPEYGGNLKALEAGAEVPAEKFLAGTSKEFPRATIAAKVAKSGAEMAPLAAVGMLPATLQKLAALGFSAQMIAGAPQQFKDFAEEYYKPPEEQDPDKLSSLWSDVIQTGVFAPLAGAGGAGLVKLPKSVRLAGELARGELTGRSRFETAAPTEARGNPFDEFDAPNVASTPVPEAPATLDAQVKLTADPESSKAATHVTPGETMPAVPEGLVTVELPDNKGTLLVNPDKAEPVDVAQAAMTGEHGKYLGMGAEAKPFPSPGGEGQGEGVLQTKVEGVPVQDEVVNAQTLPAALEASKKLAPNVTSEVKPAEEVLAERQKAATTTPLNRFTKWAQENSWPLVRDQTEAREAAKQFIDPATDREAAAALANALQTLGNVANAEPLQFKASVTPENRAKFQADADKRAVSQFKDAQRTLDGIGKRIGLKQDRGGFRMLDKQTKTPYGSRYYNFDYEGQWWNVRVADHANTADRQGIDDFSLARPRTASGMDWPQRLNIVLDEPLKSDAEAVTLAKQAIKELPQKLPKEAAGSYHWIEVRPKDGKLEFDFEEAARASEGSRETSRLDDSLKSADQSSIQPGGQRGKAVVGTDLQTSASKPTKPQAASPVKAQAKMQAQVSTVARTEGARPAKEIKSELVSRLETSIDKLVKSSKVTFEQRTHPGGEVDYLANGATWAKGYIEPANGKFKVGVQYQRDGAVAKSAGIFPTVAEAERFIKAHAAVGEGKVTIDIPGDGKFTVPNTGAHLFDVWKRARSLDTTKGAPMAKLPVGGPRGDADIIKKMVSDVERAYGDPRRALAALRAQLADKELLAEHGFDEQAVQRLNAAAEQLHNSLPEVIRQNVIDETTQSIARYERSIAHSEKELAENTAEYNSLAGVQKLTKEQRKNWVRVSAIVSRAKHLIEESRNYIAREEAKRTEVQKQLSAINAELQADSSVKEVSISYTDKDGRSSTLSAVPSEVEAAKQYIVDQGGTVEMVNGKWEKPHIAGFGGSPRTPIPRRTTPLPTPAALPPTPPPTHGVRAWLTQRRLAVQSLFAPGNIDAGARAVANTMRELLGQQAIALARAEEAMSTYRREFDHTPVPRDYVYDPSQPLPHNYAVMDAFETNRAALPPRYADLARTFDAEFEWRIKEIQKFAPQALQHLITNYFPHVWKDPVRAADVMNQISTKLFAGRKEFLKQRTLPIFADGLARGLEPISDNPVDLLLAKMHSMDKFITALRFQAEAKDMGAMKFKYIFEGMPEGYGAIDDPAFIVNKPPVVTVKEAVDDFQRAKLGELLTHLGVSYQRVASLGGRRWAEAERGTREIRAKVGASEDILWHEVGHHLDWQFPDLRNSLVFRGHGPLAEQLRALVDLNHPGEKHNPKLSYHKYLRKTEEKMAEMFRAYVHAPDLFRGAAPDVWSVMKGWLGKHPDIQSRLDAIRPGLKLSDESTDIKLGGMLTLGQWIMPDGPRTVIENYLSPGLAHSGVYRSLRAASNVLNGAQLGFSAFHLGFTSLDAAVSRASVGLESLLAGKPIDAAMKLASTPIAPITNLISGSRIRSEMLHPGTSPDVQVQQLAKLAVTGGLRATVDPFYKTEFTRKFVRAIHEGTAGGYARAISAAPFAALEQTLRPILEYIVPRQKLGVFADMARLSMEKLGPMAGVEQIREAMARAADSTENRMGQMTYDNLFYNKAVKDLALLSFRAYGWQLGKYREALGAVSDTVKAANEAAHLRPPEFTHRMAYALTLPLVVGAVGGLMHKLWTGQNPQDTRDYFFPQTGKLDVNGRPQRVALPSYMKDLVSDWHDFPNIKKMGASFYHKLNPGVSMTVDMLRNRDFYDVEIRHEDDPAWKQAEQTMLFALKNAQPFSVSGAQKLREDSSAGAQEYVLPFFGIVPAKRALSMTPAESKAADIIQDMMPAGTRTQSEADKGKLIHQLTQALKENRQNGAAQIRKAAQAGFITTPDVDRVITASVMTPLGYQVQRMPVESALKIWDLANPTERAQIADQILLKIANAQNLDPAKARESARTIMQWKQQQAAGR